MADSLRSEAYRSIVRNLREVREKAGVQQIDLSAKLGKAPNYISRIETYERRLGVVDIVLIARALGISPAKFFAKIARGVI